MSEVEKKKIGNGIEYEHPSMVTVGFHRQQGGNYSLFGSSIRHNHTIALTISSASVERNLSSDWIHQTNPLPLIEVIMSPNQFAELITTLNVGEGVPGTLRSFNGEHYDCPELPTKEEQFSQEIQERIALSLASVQVVQKEIQDSLKDDKPMGKKKQEELLHKVESFERLIKSYLPFISKQFSEQMEKTVVEAKGEVDAFVSHTIVSTGLKALAENRPQLEGPKENSNTVEKADYT